MARVQLAIGSFVVVALVTAVGCGSDPGSTFGDGSNGGENGSNNGASGGTLGSGTPTAPGQDDPGKVGNVGNVTPTDACATSNAGTALAPISLVFMIDRSGSMVQSGAASVRWNPVRDGLTTFFGDPSSKNIEASLAFFPIVQNNKEVCTAQDYAAPSVAMTALPNASPFSTAFTTTPGGGTPTEPALQGAIDYAKQVKASGKNVAVVLATDGQPNDCSSDVNGVGDIAATGVSAGIKTYVIGVGPSTGNLNTIATKGGTSAAIMIPTNNPSQVSADLIKAVGNIASSLLGCSYPLPTPPTGQTLDVNKVNVNYTPPSGGAKTLPYSGDCSNPDGWKYDAPSAPKNIILCDNACNTAKSTVGAKLDVIFGCQIAAAPGTQLPGPK
jgi:hypothetical protein